MSPIVRKAQPRVRWRSTIGPRFRVIRNTSSGLEGLRRQCEAFRVGGAVERSLAGHAEVVKGFAPESCGRSVLSQLRWRSGHGPVLEGCQDPRMDYAATTLQQTFICGIPHQCVLETVARIRGHAITEQQLG